MSDDVLQELWARIKAGQTTIAIAPLSAPQRLDLACWLASRFKPSESMAVYTYWLGQWESIPLPKGTGTGVQLELF